MQTKNDKSKAANSGSENKSTANKNSKKLGVADMPAVPKARERAQTKDFNRRGDAESNEL